MNPAQVSRVLAVIPERVARVSSGTLFVPNAAHCAHPERMALVSRYLSWLSPLNALTKDEQRELGLIAGPGRPPHAADEGDNDGWDAEDRLSFSGPDAEAYAGPGAATSGNPTSGAATSGDAEAVGLEVGDEPVGGRMRDEQLYLGGEGGLLRGDPAGPEYRD